MYDKPIVERCTFDRNTSRISIENSARPYTFFTKEYKEPTERSVSGAFLWIKKTKSFFYGLY